MKRYIIFSCLAIALGTFSLQADLLDEAATYINGGIYGPGKKLLEQALEENPKLSQNAQYLFLSGLCELAENNFPEAKSYFEAAKSKGNNDANMYLGQIAFREYDFDKASDLYAAYRKAKERQKLPVGELFEDYEEELSVAENALERVEKIIVLDSLSLPKKDFFLHYRLPASAGRFISVNDLPPQVNAKGGSIAFINETEDYLLWGEPDDIGRYRIVESEKLIESGWSEPEVVSDEFTEKGNVSYPFMMGDGQTLYFASDGEGTMGGYDIFIAKRDPMTGEYLQPMNIGMPFNSPFDDYLMAIDEENAIGWWATDRNLLGDNLTVYVYAVNDSRSNHDSEDENILEYASLKDYALTKDLTDEKTYSDLKEKLKGISPLKTIVEPSFYLPMGNGRVYTQYSDFQNRDAAKKMEVLVKEQEKLDTIEKELSDLRYKFSQGDRKSILNNIDHLEKEAENQRAKVANLKNEVYKLERK